MTSDLIIIINYNYLLNIIIYNHKLIYYNFLFTINVLYDWIIFFNVHNSELVIKIFLLNNLNKFIDIYSYLFHISFILFWLVLIYVDFTVAYVVNIKEQKLIARAQRASAAVYTSPPNDCQSLSFTQYNAWVRLIDRCDQTR